MSRSFTVDYLTDTILMPGHGLRAGDGPFQVEAVSGFLPAGLCVHVDYWAIVPMTSVPLFKGSLLHVMTPDPDRLRLAASAKNARNGVAIDLTTPGCGVLLLWPA